MSDPPPEREMWPHARSGGRSRPVVDVSFWCGSSAKRVHLVQENLGLCWASGVACARRVVRHRIEALSVRPSPKKCDARPGAPQASSLRSDHAVRGCGLDPRPSTRCSGIYVMAGDV